MFGYIKVDSSELKVKEYEFYRGTYCGLCRAMGKCTGQCSRMTLSYDFVFLALTRIAITGTKPCFEQKRCLAHPLNKRNSMVKNEALDYCAATSAILNYQKITDDISDERGMKRLKARIVLPFVAHARKKALRRSPELRKLDTAVSDKLKALAELEHSGAPSVDAPASLFGELLGEIMSFSLEGSDARIAYELGRCIGAWIYIADALDDMAEDIKKKRYNPFLLLYSGRLPNEDELESIMHAVRNHLYGAEAAFDLMTLDEGAIKSIIQNILYLGIPEKTEKIIQSHNKEISGKEKAND